MTVRALAVCSLVGAVSALIASPAGATPASRCDLSNDPTVERAACLPHHVWDAITSGRPAGVACAIERTLGVDNVKECHAEP